MNFELSDDQQAIKRSAGEFLAARLPLEQVRKLVDAGVDAPDELWPELAQLGWPGVVVDEDQGGLGLGIVELAVIQEELGYALAPTPLLSSVAAGLLLQAAGEHAPPRGLATGETRGTVALWDEGATSCERNSSLEAHGGTLSGVKIAVPDAAAADFIVVAGAGGRHFLVERGAGVSIEPASSIDPTRRLFTVRFDGAAAADLGGDSEAWGFAYDAVAVAVAAESVGVAQRAMEMAVAYAKDRKQFGRPIGSYQAVSHRCAQMLLEVNGARALTYFAGWALDHEPADAPLAASMAKAYASDAGWRVPASAIQVHGGIGFTWEHDLHLYLKRGKSNAYAFGDARWHLDRVADLVDL